MGDPVTLKTTKYASLVTAWESFAQIQGGALPTAGAMALAPPVDGDLINLTNNPWIITHPQPGLFGAAAAFADQHKGG